MNKLLQDLNIDVMQNHTEITVGSILKERFVLEKKIGHGGMGTVYKARDLRREEANVSAPYVAIKIINNRLKEHPLAFTALQSEAAKAQALNHENIIRVYDFDREGETAFITMEYLEGISLDKLLKSFIMQGLSYQQKLDIVTTVGKALLYAHQQGCIHADLKPSNIFITNKNVVKIIDFGLANAISETDDDSTVHSQSLHAFTPAYSSKEVLAGKKPTTLDDVYAFACVAYEFLVGYHPYDSASAKDVDIANTPAKKIQFMPKKQWAMLHKALAVNVNKRKVTLQKLLDAFTNKNSTNHKLWWLLGFIAVATIIFLANQLDPII